MKGFHYKQDTKLEWRWNLKDGNNKVVADSAEGYQNKTDCEKGAQLFTTLGPNAPEHEKTPTSAGGDGPLWKYFEDKKGEWRWHFQAKNNRIIADGAEGYDSKANVLRAITNVKALLKELGGGSNPSNGGSYIPPAAGGATGGGRFA